MKIMLKGDSVVVEGKGTEERLLQGLAGCSSPLTL